MPERIYIDFDEDDDPPSVQRERELGRAISRLESECEHTKQATEKIQAGTLQSDNLNHKIHDLKRKIAEREAERKLVAAQLAGGTAAAAAAAPALPSKANAAPQQQQQQQQPSEKRAHQPIPYPKQQLVAKGTTAAPAQKEKSRPQSKPAPKPKVPPAAAGAKLQQPIPIVQPHLILEQRQQQQHQKQEMQMQQLIQMQLMNVQHASMYGASFPPPGYVPQVYYQDAQAAMLTPPGAMGGSTMGAGGAMGGSMPIIIDPGAYGQGMISPAPPVLTKKQLKRLRAEAQALANLEKTPKMTKKLRKAQAALELQQQKQLQAFVDEGLGGSSKKGAKKKTPGKEQKINTPVAPGPPNPVGHFEAHTTGIGTKLLSNMGWAGPGVGLGKDGTGIPTALEAQWRPKGMGVGFGGRDEPHLLPTQNIPLPLQFVAAPATVQQQGAAAGDPVSPLPLPEGPGDKDKEQDWNKNEKEVRLDIQIRPPGVLAAAVVDGSEGAAGGGVLIPAAPLPRPSILPVDKQAIEAEKRALVEQKKVLVQLLKDAQTQFIRLCEHEQRLAAGGSGGGGSAAAAGHNVGLVTTSGDQGDTSSWAAEDAAVAVEKAERERRGELDKLASLASIRIAARLGHNKHGSGSSAGDAVASGGGCGDASKSGTAGRLHYERLLCLIDGAGASAPATAAAAAAAFNAAAARLPSSSKALEPASKAAQGAVSALPKAVAAGPQPPRAVPPPPSSSGAQLPTSAPQPQPQPVANQVVKVQPSTVAPLVVVDKPKAAADPPPKEQAKPAGKEKEHLKPATTEQLFKSAATGKDKEQPSKPAPERAVGSSEQGLSKKRDRSTSPSPKRGGEDGRPTKSWRDMEVKDIPTRIRDTFLATVQKLASRKPGLPFPMADLEAQVQAAVGRHALQRLECSFTKLCMLMQKGGYVSMEIDHGVWMLTQTPVSNPIVGAAAKSVLAGRNGAAVASGAGEGAKFQPVPQSQPGGSVSAPAPFKAAPPQAKVAPSQPPPPLLAQLEAAVATARTTLAAAATPSTAATAAALQPIAAPSIQFSTSTLPLRKPPFWHPRPPTERKTASSTGNTNTERYGTFQVVDFEWPLCPFDVRGACKDQGCRLQMQQDYDLPHPDQATRAPRVPDWAIHEVSTQGAVPRYRRATHAGGLPPYSTACLVNRCTKEYGNPVSVSRRFKSLALSSLVDLPRNGQEAPTFYARLCESLNLGLPGWDISAPWMKQRSSGGEPLPDIKDINQALELDKENPWLWVLSALGAARRVAEQRNGSMKQAHSTAVNRLARALEHLPESPILRPLYLRCFLAVESISIESATAMVKAVNSDHAYYHNYIVAGEKWHHLPKTAAWQLQRGAGALARQYGNLAAPDGPAIAAILDLALQSLAALARMQVEPLHTTTTCEYLAGWLGNPTLAAMAAQVEKSDEYVETLMQEITANAQSVLQALKSSPAALCVLHTSLAHVAAYDTLPMDVYHRLGFPQDVFSVEWEQGPPMPPDKANFAALFLAHGDSMLSACRLPAAATATVETAAAPASAPSGSAPPLPVSVSALLGVFERLPRNAPKRIFADAVNKFTAVNKFNGTQVTLPGVVNLDFELGCEIPPPPPLPPPPASEGVEVPLDAVPFPAVPLPPPPPQAGHTRGTTTSDMELDSAGEEEEEGDGVEGQVRKKARFSSSTGGIRQAPPSSAASNDAVKECFAILQRYEEQNFSTAYLDPISWPLFEAPPTDTLNTSAPRNVRKEVQNVARHVPTFVPQKILRVDPADLAFVLKSIRTLTRAELPRFLSRAFRAWQGSPSATVVALQIAQRYAVLADGPLWRDPGVSWALPCIVSALLESRPVAAPTLWLQAVELATKVSPAAGVELAQAACDAHPNNPRLEASLQIATRPPPR